MLIEGETHLSQHSSVSANSVTEMGFILIGPEVFGEESTGLSNQNLFELAFMSIPPHCSVPPSPLP